MRIRIRSAALLALAFAVGSCSDQGTLNPTGPGGGLAPTAGPSFALDASPMPEVRISEIHYDNIGTDAGEAIEVSAPISTNLGGWSIVLYNGSNGAVYDTDLLTELERTTCTSGSRFVVVLSYPPNGIQNGSPDGMALVDAGGNVVEFLSYEGAFTAVGGPANGMTSTIITTSESGSEPLGQSLQRSGSDVWSTPITNTFGACNDESSDEPPPPPPPPGLADTRFSEIHYDNDGIDVGEAIEVEAPAGTDLTGWSIVLYNGSNGAAYDTDVLTGLIPATCGTRKVVVVTYPSNGIQNGSPDGVALVDAAAKVVEFLSYEGTFTAVGGPADGMESIDINVSEGSSSPVGLSVQRNAAGMWQAPATSSFGVCNGSGDPPPPPAKTISFSGRTPGDVALPVGFEDQLFATLRDGSGTVVPTTFTWTSETPGVASIDERGVMRALGTGTATVRATAADGTTATFSLPTRLATASTTALYAGNAEFGEPKDGNASGDFIVRHDQYTSSYNKDRGTPNWVSYNLEATHFGPEDRCDCFTFDPALLAAGLSGYTTADYTGAGDFHGYGIDRGHLARSFDRTSGSLDNAFTFYFTNIIPQAADNNQGPWAILENHLGDLARNSNKEVYIVAGVAGTKGTVKNEGKIVIPAQVWKVAVILPRNQGLANIDSYDDLEVLAVILPNDPGIRNVNWETYKTTVDAVEALSGYNVLDLLPDQVEIAIESATKPPTAAIDGPFTALEREPVSMSAAASSDPDGDALTYAWTFGDGATGSGANVSHAYARDGVYTVRVVVTDVRGLTATATTTVTVLTPAQGTQLVISDVDQLVRAGRLAPATGNALTSKLDAAVKQLEANKIPPAVGQLEAFVNQVDALVSSNRLSRANADRLQNGATRVIRSVSP